MPRSESFYRSIARDGNWNHRGVKSSEDGMTDKNILNFKFPGLENPINIKFPISYLLQACEECHLNKRTKATCRVRLSHKSAPWSPIFLCMIFDDTCLDNNSNLLDKPFSAKVLLHEYHEIFCSAEVLSDIFPACLSCRKHSLTRHNCRTEALHKDMPWCTVFVAVTSKYTVGNNNQANSGNTSIKSSIMNMIPKQVYPYSDAGSFVTKSSFSDRANTERLKLKTFLVSVSGRTCTAIRVEEKSQGSNHNSNELRARQGEPYRTSINKEHDQIDINIGDPRMTYLHSQDYQNSTPVALANPDITQFPLQNKITQIRNIQNDCELHDNHYLSSQVHRNCFLDPTQEIMNKYYFQGRTLGSRVFPDRLSQRGSESLQESLTLGMSSSPEHLNHGTIRDNLTQTSPRTYSLFPSKFHSSDMSTLGGLGIPSSSFHNNVAIDNDFSKVYSGFKGSYQSHLGQGSSSSYLTDSHLSDSINERSNIQNHLDCTPRYP